MVVAAADDGSEADDDEEVDGDGIEEEAEGEADMGAGDIYEGAATTVV
jgi:hypothetical protein